MTVQRARRDFVRQWPFTLVLLTVGAGFLGGVLWPQHWLRGVSVIAVGLIGAGALRIVLAPSRAGMLVMRSRLGDIVCYVGLGGLTFTFGVLVHR